MNRPGTEQSPQRPRLSLVFPAFDEEGNLDTLIRSARKIAGDLAGDFEIVVVNDGSRDRSPALLDAWSEEDPRIRVVHHARNSGYGAALRSGLDEARGESIFFSDSDLQFDLEQLADLLAHADDFDIVAGYRSPLRDPWPRILIARVWSGLMRLVFGLRVRDIDCAFKLFSRRVVESIPLSSVGAFINTELLVRARTEGFKIHQVPIRHRRRRYGRQSGAHPRVILKACVELGSLYRELRKVESPARARSETG